jgi:hypothetical protein
MMVHHLSNFGLLSPGRKYTSIPRVSIAMNDILRCVVLDRYARLV